MQGCYIYDANGNKYLDALAGLLSTALGICACFWMCIYNSLTNNKCTNEFLVWFSPTSKTDDGEQNI